MLADFAPWSGYFFEELMSKAIDSIVSSYVLLKNRKALEDLLAHRQKLLDGLQRVSGIEPKLLLSEVVEEIAIIQTALKRLDHAGAQDPDQAKVLPLTMSDVSANIDNGASTAGPGTDQLVLPPARKTDVGLAATQAASALHQERTPARVLGLAISVASTGSVVPPPSEPPGAVGGLDPGSFALYAPSSNEAMQLVEARKEEGTPYRAVDAFKSLVWVWKKGPTKP
jgi:hypothetical protein